MRAYEGGCHCGAVRFRVRTAERRVVDCNCSICRKKGYLHLIVPPSEVEIIRGADALATYEFNTRVAKHRFCRTCGVHPLYRPRSHPDHVSVNLRCLDGADPSEFEIVPFDGQNWEANVETIR